MRVQLILSATCLLAGCPKGGEGAVTRPPDARVPLAAPQATGQEADLSAEPFEAVTPDPDYGRLRLRCEPPNAEVLVNGVTQGLASDFAAPRSLKLEPGLHRIEVRKAGYATFRAEVVVAPEVLETVPVTLRRLPALREEGAGEVAENEDELKEAR